MPHQFESHPVPPKRTLKHNFTPMISPPPPRVAVIGGGYAGMAAAVTLAQHNVVCQVFEAGKVLGGRARRVSYHDVDLDNGQHILLGAYRELQKLMALVGAPQNALARFPLTLILYPAFALHAPRLPAPLHLAWALLSARGLSWQDRVAALRFAFALKRMEFKIPGAISVAQLLAAQRQSEPLIRCLWAPLCIAALNTPLERASAQVFANVLRDALFTRRADSDLLLPRVDLSALFPEPGARWLREQGSRVDTGLRIDSVTASSGQFMLTDQHGATHSFDAVICAVAPHQLDSIALPFLPASAITAYEPIFTVYLCYSPHVVLPFPLLGRSSGSAHWMLDRGALGGAPGLIAAVISASGAHQAMSHDEIALKVQRELEEMTGPLPTPLWYKVIAEKFATFACQADTLRPAVRTPLDGLYLAGDYVDGDYPATLEGAVRSGMRAAHLADEFLNTLKR